MRESQRGNPWRRFWNAALPDTGREWTTTIAFGPTDALSRGAREVGRGLWSDYQGNRADARGEYGPVPPGVKPVLPRRANYAPGGVGSAPRIGEEEEEGNAFTRAVRRLGATRNNNNSGSRQRESEPGAPVPAYNWGTGQPWYDTSTPSAWEQGQAPSFPFQQAVPPALRSEGTDPGEAGYGVLRSSAAAGGGGGYMTPAQAFAYYNLGGGTSGGIGAAVRHAAEAMGGGSGGGSGGSGSGSGSSSGGSGSGSSSSGGAPPWYSSANVRTGTRIR